MATKNPSMRIVSSVLDGSPSSKRPRPITRNHNETRPIASATSPARNFPKSSASRQIGCANTRLIVRRLNSPLIASIAGADRQDRAISGGDRGQEDHRAADRGPAPGRSRTVWPALKYVSPPPQRNEQFLILSRAFDPVAALRLLPGQNRLPMVRPSQLWV
jgi:hypothetical protein